MLLLNQYYTFATRPAICYLSFHPALNSTFVGHYQQLVEPTNPAARKTVIIHINSLDEVLNRYEYPQQINQVVMVGEDKIAVMVTGMNVIEIVDLRRRDKKQIQFSFTGNPSKLQSFYFPQSQLLAVKQVYPEKYNYCNMFDTEITLSYIDLGSAEGNEVVNYRLTKESSKTKILGSKAHKGNNESLLILFKKQRTTLTILLHKLHLNKKGQKQSCYNQVQIDSYPRELDFRAWQFRKGEILLVFMAAVGGFVKIVSLEDGGVREPKISIAENGQRIQPVFMKDYTFFREGISASVQNINFKGIYRCSLMSHRQQSIIFNSFQQKCLTGDKLCSYDPTYFLQIHSNTSRKVTEVTKTRQVPVRQIFMQMLLHIQEDFDDDLLMDAVYLLDEF